MLRDDRDCCLFQSASASCCLRVFLNHRCVWWHSGWHTLSTEILKVLLLVRQTNKQTKNKVSGRRSLRAEWSPGLGWGHSLARRYQRPLWHHKRLIFFFELSRFLHLLYVKPLKNAIILRHWILHLQSMDTKVRVMQFISWHQSCHHFMWPGDTALCLSASEKSCLSPAGHFQFCCVPFKGNEAAETRNGTEPQLILLLSRRHHDLLSLLQAGCFLIGRLWALTY